MVGIPPGLLPFANLALTNPDLAGKLAASETAGAGAGVSPAPAAPIAAPGAPQNNLGLALQGVQALAPPEVPVLQAPGVGVGGGSLDPSALLALLFSAQQRQQSQQQPSLGQLLLGR